jgi:hypothetical protein
LSAGTWPPDAAFDVVATDFGCTIYHIFRVLEERGDLRTFFQQRITAADVDQKRFVD